MKQNTKQKDTTAKANGNQSDGADKMDMSGREQDSDQQKENGQQLKGSPLEKFFTDQLKDIYYAEQQLVKALEEMQQACTTEELEDAFASHRRQTKRHIKRLDKVFQQLGMKAEGKQCEAMDGLLKEARTIISETKENSMTRDAALIVAAQKVEHYEIATYGGLVQLALTMKLQRVAGILDKTLNEEDDTDRQLTDIAEQYINIEAEEEGNYSWSREREMSGAEQ